MLFLVFPPFLWSTWAWIRGSEGLARWRTTRCPPSSEVWSRRWASSRCATRGTKSPAPREWRMPSQNALSIAQPKCAAARFLPFFLFKGAKPNCASDSERLNLFEDVPLFSTGRAICEACVCLASSSLSFEAAQANNES